MFSVFRNECCTSEIKIMRINHLTIFSGRPMDTIGYNVYSLIPEVL